MGQKDQLKKFIVTAL